MVLFCAAFLLFSFLGTRQQNIAAPESFHQLLRQYDILAHEIEVLRQPVDDAQRVSRLNLHLDRLEASAIGADSLVSVLKRRRNLARFHPQYDWALRQSAQRAVDIFPWSQPIAAVAASVFIKSSPLGAAERQQVRALIPVLVDQVYAPLQMYLHVLLGDFQSPEIAFALDTSSLPNFGQLGALGLSAAGNSPEIEALVMNLAIVRILNNDIQGASQIVETMLNFSPSADFLMFAAEFHYDFGDIRRSAELFSRAPGLFALSRQADALWLGGYTDSARMIWAILGREAQNDGRSLYNLAVTSQDNNEAAGLLERLMALPPESFDQRGPSQELLEFGLIRYSRLFDSARAISLLETGRLRPADHPLIDLEIRKRRTETEDIGRQTAETWLLLERHFGNHDLYSWAAWFFDFHLNHGQTAMLLSRNERHGFSGNWALFYQAAKFMRQGNLQAAENSLRSIPANEKGWYVFANLGRIFEERNYLFQALEYYETALAKLALAPLLNPQMASGIKLRMARCFTRLGLIADARDALEQALKFDPGNINVHFELGRLP